MKPLFALSLFFLATSAAAQQVPDKDFRPAVGAPTFTEGQGPVVCLDEAHHNFHTLDGRFFAFGALLQRDGYVVQPSRGAFDAKTLSPCTVLVISNALPNTEDWAGYPSPTPFAFTASEVEAVKQWVDGGGRLLLIADHQPLAGAAANLAAAFDVRFTDGFAFEGFTDEAKREVIERPTIFRRSDGGLADHAITRGRNEAESIASLRSFTGQAFRAPANAQALMVMPKGSVSLQPKTAWAFQADTPYLDVGGWLQGAVMPVGQGRAAFFGEAAMFSAQLAGPQKQPMGMNAPEAERNGQFVLNLMHWLIEEPVTAAKP
ncbi:hypothetical protein [Arenimonas sp.]|uniref:hypothetical protein n=1 Tax=Arenimonas sp. TaxID=1872635 RepID=UPI0039E2F6AE